MKYLLLHIGQFFIMIKKVFSLPEKKSIFLKQFSLELEKTGLNSIGIVTIISFFIGAVVAIQTAYNFDSPLYPKYLHNVNKNGDKTCWNYIQPKLGKLVAFLELLLIFNLLMESFT